MVTTIADTEHAQRQLHSIVYRIVLVKPVSPRDADTTAHVSIYYVNYVQLQLPILAPK